MTVWKSISYGALYLGLVSSAGVAWAAPVPASVSSSAQGLTNVFDPGLVGKEVKKATSRPSVTPVASPRLTQPATNAIPAADKIRFKLDHIVLVGNTVFKNNVLASLVQPYLHRVVSLAELEKLVHIITVKYRDAGYILSRAILPPQTIKNGIVKIQIIEGFVSDVAISGNPGKAQLLLLRFGKHIMHSRPLQVHTLQRYALLANDVPGMSVQVVLKPAPKTPAGAELTFVVDRKVQSGYVSYDNLGTRYIGPHQLTFNENFYSVLAPGDINSFQFTEATRPHELQYGSFTHGQPIGSNGLRMQAGVTYTETMPGFILKLANIHGRNTLFFGGLSYPIIRDREQNLVIHSTFNYQNVTASILAQPFYQDRLRTLVMGASYDRADSYHGANSLAMDVTHGFNIWGAKFHENQSHPLGQSQYTRFNPSISRLQGLTSHISLLASIRGQYAFEPLLATEQFGLGGPDLGRGYDPSEIVGDHGLGGKLEFRVDAVPDYKLLQSVQYYLFYDVGLIWNIDKVNLPAKQSLASTGAGARFNFMPHLTGNLFAARPLTHSVGTQVALGRDPEAVRVFFQITATF